MTTALLSPPAKPPVSSDVAGRDSTASSGRLDGIVVGCLIGFDRSGRPLVRFDEADRATAIVARAAAALSREDVNRDVAILCEAGDSTKPIIIGLMHKDRPDEAGADTTADDGPDEVELDLTAKRQITLKCGKASITLTRAGKIILRGTYLFSRSSGVNKIKGGSVQIN